VQQRQRRPEAGVGDRPHRAHQRQRRHPLGQAGGDAGGVGTAAGDAAHGEAPVAQLVHQRRHVVGEGAQGRPGGRVGQAVAPPVGGYDGQAEALAGLVRDRELHARSWRPMQEQDGCPARIAVDAKPERAPVGEPQALVPDLVDHEDRLVRAARAHGFPQFQRLAKQGHVSCPFFHVCILEPERQFWQDSHPLLRMEQ
jgi:hypothetical protein